MQFIGAALIMLACGMMGLTVPAAMFLKRRTLNNSSPCSALENEIGYARTALPRHAGASALSFQVQ